MRNLKGTKKIPIWALSISLLFLVPSLSFASAHREKDYPEELRMPKGAETQSPSEIAPVKPLEYYLSEDDVLDITVWKYIRPKEKKEGVAEGEYLINKGDILEISVWQWPDLLKEAIVRPDGRISYPLVGDVEVEGLTLTQLKDILTEKLKDYIKMPQVSVMVKQFGTAVYGAGYTGKTIDLPFAKIDDLSTTQVVRPDGKIAFPLLGDITARGLTVAKLSQGLVDKLSSFVRDIQVTVSIKTFGGRKIIVLGEVARPGVYKPTGEISLLEAIAMAEGYTQDAILKNVIVIGWADGKPVAKTYNLLAAIRRADLTQNASIQGGDIVYVPKSHISNLNYFLNQFVSPLLTASSSTSAIKVLRTGTSIPGK